MNKLGLILLTIGFLGAAIASVRETDSVVERVERIPEIETPSGSGQDPAGAAEEAASAAADATPVVEIKAKDELYLRWKTINWPWYSVFFGMGVVGVVMVRVAARSSVTESHKLQADVDVIGRSLQSLVAKLQDINTRQKETNVYEVHGWIDETLMSDLAAFVEVRESLIHMHGLQAYANLMNEFATSERNINRSWSASADGYVDEVWKCMRHAEAHMSRARQLFAEYSAS